MCSDIFCSQGWMAQVHSHADFCHQTWPRKNPHFVSIAIEFAGNLQNIAMKSEGFPTFTTARAIATPIKWLVDD